MRPSVRLCPISRQCFDNFLFTRSLLIWTIRNFRWSIFLSVVKSRGSHDARENGSKGRHMTSTSKVAGLFDPGGPATEPRAKRGAHPSYYETRSLSHPVFGCMILKYEMNLRIAIFRRKLQIFKYEMNWMKNQWKELMWWKIH